MAITKIAVIHSQRIQDFSCSSNVRYYFQHLRCCWNIICIDWLLKLDCRNQQYLQLTEFQLRVCLSNWGAASQPWRYNNGVMLSLKWHGVNSPLRSRSFLLVYIFIYILRWLFTPLNFWFHVHTAYPILKNNITRGNQFSQWLLWKHFKGSIPSKYSGSFNITKRPILPSSNPRWPLEEKHRSILH